MYKSRLTQEQRAAVVKELFQVATAESVMAGSPWPFCEGICIHLQSVSLKQEAADLQEAIDFVVDDTIYAFLPSALGFPELSWKGDQEVREIWLKHWVETGEAWTERTFPNDALPARMWRPE